jgi:hypothetical protein
LLLGEEGMLELCLAVILIMAINRFFRNRDAAAPRKRGAFVPRGPVDDVFDWLNYWRKEGDEVMQRLLDDMHRDCEEFIERMNDNRYRLMNDYRKL